MTRIRQKAELPVYLYFGRGGSRAAETSKMEHFVIIVNGFQLDVGCGSSPRSTSASIDIIKIV